MTSSSGSSGSGGTRSTGSGSNRSRTPRLSSGAPVPGQRSLFPSLPGRGSSSALPGLTKRLPARPATPPSGASTTTPAISRPRPRAQFDVIIGALVILALARLLPDRPAVWIVAVLVGAAVIAAGRAVISNPSGSRAPDPAGRGSAATGRQPSPGAALAAATRTDPAALLVGDDVRARVVAGIEAGIVPGVMAAGLALSIRLVPLGYELIPALALGAFAIDRALSAERRWAADGPSGDTRFMILVIALAAAFVGFTGVATLVSNGFNSLGIAAGTAGAAGSGENALVVLAIGDGLIAGLLGYRLVRLGPTSPRDALVSALTYAAVIAIGAGLFRAMAVPQLLGPALLTLLVYLWDAFHATTPSIRRDPRWLWQIGLLVALAAIVVAWNLALRK